MSITKNHPEWPGFRRDILETPMEALKEKLCSPQLSAEDTASIRGQIMTYREIISAIENPGAASGGGYRYSDTPPTMED